MDGDGFGDADSPVQACVLPEGAVEDATDCDDDEADAWPGAVEVCDGIDNDCDELVDDDDDDLDLSTTSDWHLDEDGDGYGQDAAVTQACAQPSGSVAEAGDCDDGDGAINPGATEVCDDADVDEDCDGYADDNDPDASGLTTWYVDTDGDGYGTDTLELASCDQPSGFVADNTDCNDATALSLIHI